MSEGVNKEYKVPVQSLIDHIKTAMDVDPWAKEMAEDLLSRMVPAPIKGESYCGCSCCGAVLFDEMKYCPCCGQAIDWRTR